MKKITEQIGKTTEEAIRKGLEELKVSRDDVKIEILEEATSGGVLGILSAKMAKVRLTVDKKISDTQYENTEKISSGQPKNISVVWSGRQKWRRSR